MIRYFALFWLAIAGASFAAGQAPKLSAKLPDAMGAMRALPGVYRIHAIGKGEILAPKVFRLDKAQLEADLAKASAMGGWPENLTAGLRGWWLVSRAPAKYLRPSAEFDRWVLGASSGSGFAVSREGVILTNRHVVEEFKDAPCNVQDVLEMHPPCLESLEEELAEKLGELNAKDTYAGEIGAEILQALGQQCRKNFAVEQVFVAIAYADPAPKTGDPDRAAAKLFGLGAELRKPILAPAKVVDRGGAGLASDVAILRIEWDVIDSLICLPLAEEEAIELSAPMYSLGFPAHRYDDQVMTQLQLNTVNVETGKIDWIPSKRELTWRQSLEARISGFDEAAKSLLIVTAPIRGGASGGPVILADGSVAGLNVAHRSLRADAEKAGARGKHFAAPFARESLDFAVPIKVAKELLEKNGITVEIGDTTRLWREGMDLFDAGKKQEAKAKFEEVARKQIARAVEKPFGQRQAAPISIVSHYVVEMIERCERK